jgi:hypothetical protein
MSSLGSLLMYMVFDLPNSATEWILRSPFTLVERGAEAGPGGSKSAAAEGGGGGGGKPT